jgi:2-oxoglutarate ferredoxin oxidoreductase subunit delta
MGESNSKRPMTAKTNKGRIVIDSSLCKGCYLCISVCPNECIVVSDETNEKGYHPARFINAKGDRDHACTGCALCAIMCPDIAIEVYRG